MKRLGSVLLGLLLLLPALSGAVYAQTLTADQVVEKHLAAMGGREALAKITSRKVTGTVTIGTPAGDLSGPVEIDSKAPNKTRASMSLDLTALGGPGSITVEQLFDGKTGWALNSMQGDTPITGHQLENMTNSVFPSPLLGYKDAGVKLDVLPADKVNGRDAIVVNMTPKTGAAVKLFFDAETFMVVRTVATIDNPMDGSVMEQVSEPTDYRTVDGIKVPFTIVNSNAAQSVTIKVDKVLQNVAIDDAVFVKK